MPILALLVRTKVPNVPLQGLMLTLHEKLITVGIVKLVPVRLDGGEGGPSRGGQAKE